MVRMILSQLRRRPGRASALLAGVLLATLGFTVLTGSTATSQLIVQGTVNENARGSYDILVRPTGARTGLESGRGLVQANFLAGQYGGITMDQWHKIQALSGVDVAAPIAMIGYVQGATDVRADIDLTDLVDRSLQRQLIRVQYDWIADAGLTQARDPMPTSVYVTKNTIHWATLVDPSGDVIRWDDGRSRSAAACTPSTDAKPPDRMAIPYEVLPDGSEKPICIPGIGGGYSYVQQRGVSYVFQLMPDGTLRNPQQPSPDGRLVASLYVPMTMLMAAVDPAAEAALTGIDKAMVEGRFLRPDEPSLAASLYPGHDVAPAVLANTSYLSESVRMTVDRLVSPNVSDPWARYPTTIGTAPAGPTLRTRTVTNDDLYPALLQESMKTNGRALSMMLVVQSGSPTIQVSGDGALRPADQPLLSQQSRYVGWGNRPVLNGDSAQRPTQFIERIRSLIEAAVGVGVYDPTKLRHGGAYSLPLDTYTPDIATGGDQRSKGLLGEQPIGPTSNVGGYLAAPPTALIPLGLWASKTLDKDVISAVRVRVAGVTGFDPVSREKVRLVAEDIAKATGLDVEVMLGASGEPQTVQLPAGNFGRPELTLAELWAKKGVAAAIVQAIDRKSIVLFGLILVVCFLFLANAITAAVQDRRRDLAILACMGWPRSRLAALFIGEVAAIGLTAGLVAALLARPVGALAGIAVSTGRAWLAVPVALVLCVAAALVPARRASRTHPLRALHLVSRRIRARRPRRTRMVLTMARRNLRRRPGRAGLAALALAVGCAGLSLILTITVAFHGTVTGTVLGDAVSLRARGVDILSVIAVLVLAAGAVADVLYLNVRDRAGEFAALRATGWSDFSLGRLVVYEALGIGLLGGLAGAGLGLAGAALFTGQVTNGLVWTLGITAAAGTVLAGIAATVPAMLQKRVPVALLLAEE